MQKPMSEIELIYPDWPAPAGVHALSTTRQGGASGQPWDSLNLGDHVGDDLQAVARNRCLLSELVGLPAEPVWLRQVHGCDVLDARDASPGCEADALYSSQIGEVCAVLTADCLPVLLCDREGTQVATAHAGWRGLASGVIESALNRFTSEPSGIMAWLGPAIGQQAFEVGAEVRQAFVSANGEAEQAFSPSGDRWLCDLYLLAMQRLNRSGVTEIYGGGYCTYTEQDRFFSYRRDGQTGRMASMIWREA